MTSEGFRYRVINAGISGETSSGALSRVNWILTLKPDIVILETGANDGLRGVDPVLTKKNIQEIIRLLQANDVTVILAGIRQSAGGGLTLAGGLGPAEDLTLFQENLDGGVGPKTGEIILTFRLVLLLEDLLPDHIPDLG